MLENTKSFTITQCGRIGNNGHIGQIVRKDL
jgi:hypothetical protein